MTVTGEVLDCQSNDSIEYRSSPPPPTDTTPTLCSSTLYLMYVMENVAVLDCQSNDSIEYRPSPLPPTDRTPTLCSSNVLYAQRFICQWLVKLYLMYVMENVAVLDCQSNDSIEYRPSPLPPTDRTPTLCSSNVLYAQRFICQWLVKLYLMYVMENGAVLDCQSNDSIEYRHHHRLMILLNI
ncbi:hypothetical protein J6590_065039 [Homalodisca vitripennis]|nr:hypothetical protein J6590_065039 [Homalodisca vitripennis]